MFEAQDTSVCDDQGESVEVTELKMHSVINKNGYLVFKSLDRMVEGDKLKSKIKFGTQGELKDVQSLEDENVFENVKSSFELKKSQTCSIDFDSSTFEVGEITGAILDASSKITSVNCSVFETLLTLVSLIPQILKGLKDTT